MPSVNLFQLLPTGRICAHAAAQPSRIEVSTVHSFDMPTHDQQPGIDRMRLRWYWNLCKRLFKLRLYMDSSDLVCSVRLPVQRFPSYAGHEIPRNLKHDAPCARGWADSIILCSKSKTDKLDSNGAKYHFPSFVALRYGSSGNRRTQRRRSSLAWDLCMLGPRCYWLTSSLLWGSAGHKHIQDQEILEWPKRVGSHQHSYYAIVRLLFPALHSCHCYWAYLVQHQHCNKPLWWNN